MVSSHRLQREARKRGDPPNWEQDQRGSLCQKVSPEAVRHGPGWGGAVMGGYEVTWKVSGVRPHLRQHPGPILEDTDGTGTQARLPTGHPHLRVLGPPAGRAGCGREAGGPASETLPNINNEVQGCGGNDQR